MAYGCSSNTDRLDSLWTNVQSSAGEGKMKKVLTIVRPLTEPRGKAKFCAHCGDPATQEALFRVDESVMLIERYCDRCVKDVK